jgi:DNA-binding NarL/FixJ family response regulator
MSFKNFPLSLLPQVAGDLPATLSRRIAASITESAEDRLQRLSNERPTRSEITQRQMEVLLCLVEGKPTKRICRELGISEGTAKVHIAAIFRTLKVHNRTEATLAALRSGWIQPEMWSRA